MADNESLRFEYPSKSSILKKRLDVSDDDDSSSERVIPSKSPRYMRKKRVPIGQGRKYHSQLSAQGKIYSNRQKSSENCNDAVFQSVSGYDCNSIESHSTLNIELNKSLKGSDFQKVNTTLSHSNSLPSLSSKPENKVVRSASCDNLQVFQSDEAIEAQLSVDTVDSILSITKLNQTETRPLDTISCNGSIKENVSVDSKSRRSSTTSTLRERNNSQDSAFSQISIIDIAEAEEAAKAIDRISVANTNSNWKPHHSRSKSDATCEIHKNETDDNEVFSLPSSFNNKEKIRKKSIFEGQQMIVPTECFFPRPQQGQSLTSFLSSNEFSISAELDRENAHFCISDALIAAIEHMKCSRSMRVVEEDDESDEEIRNLTQRIRIRRSERQREKVVFKSITLLSDGKTDTTSQSASPPLSSHSSDFEVESLCSEDEIEDLELSTQTDSNLSSMKVNGLSLSMASLYSEADIQKSQTLLRETDNRRFQESDTVTLTAESVALSLLKKFSEKHLPKASDLQWLVSEQDAPQRLLPLPNSWPVSPDAVEEEYNLGNTRLRGNLEWAPPRPQIIFMIHPSMKRDEIIEKQKFRCAGCGMKIEKSYIKRFRYCDYFGKYFCQCCHSNSLAYIPGRILWKWNFTKYYVSRFAWELLDQMFLDPLFNIEDVNNNLYQKVRLLDSCRNYRMQLFYLKDFIRTCRKAESLQALLEKQNHHIIYEPHMYSISDLVQVKSGDLSKNLSMIVNQCSEHVKHCILCQAKGFICEICQKDSDIIFPFQFQKVILCQKCGSCFHKRCCKKIQCPRCKRIQERKKRLAEHKSEDEL